MGNEMWHACLYLVVLLVCRTCATGLALGNDDHRVEVKIGKRVTIAADPHLSHEMLGMVRHPDGTIFVKTQTGGLYKSSDNGQTWTPVPVNLPDAPPSQVLMGLGVTGDGRLWLVHQTAVGGRDLFVSCSTDGGVTWTTTPIDFGKFAPAAAQRPYVLSYNDGNTFIERPGPTLMFSVGLRYEEAYYQESENLVEGLVRPDADVGGEIMLRSTNRGNTWGDPTLVHPFVCEVSYAVDPSNSSHILAMTRIQRALLAGEDREAVLKKTGAPPDVPSDRPSIYKNGLLLESSDGGRTFHEVAGGLTEYYGHRGTIVWTKNNVVVVTHQGGIPGKSGSDGRLLARISMDGGKTWVDGTRTGTPLMNQSQKLVLVPTPPGHSFTAPAIELSANHFLTVYAHRYPASGPLNIEGVFWHIETPASEAKAAMVRNIGNDKQLFIDDDIIESLEGASKRLNQPVKYPANPVLPSVPAWEAGLVVNFASVVFDEQDNLFKMWYGLGDPHRGDEEFLLAYAASQDGIQWEKPSLGLFEYRGTTQNNVVRARNGCACAVFKDANEIDPARRYKLLYQDHGIRACAAYAADGLHWTEYNDGQPVIPEGRDSQNVAWWDEQLGKYVALVRERTGKLAEVRRQIVEDEDARQTYRKLWGGQDPEKKTLRRVGQAESEDFVHWTPIRVVLEADSDDPLLRGEFYNVEVMQYEGLRIGLMTVFSYSQDYCQGQVQVVYSRDGMHWHRGGNREVFLPRSDRPGDFDWGSIYPCQGPLVVGDEIWIYYTGCNYDHNLDLPDGVTEIQTGIGLAKLRLGGFVSVDAEQEGTLTTKPLTFSGEKLIINADAKRGHILVEILDADAKPIPQFGPASCDALERDEIRHIVTWQGVTNLSGLAGKVVKLRFHLKEAKLFSFQFK